MLFVFSISLLNAYCQYRKDTYFWSMTKLQNIVEKPLNISMALKMLQYFKKKHFFLTKERFSYEGFPVY